MHNNLIKKDAIHQDRGRRGLKLERVYRELYDLNRYRKAYAKLYSTAGAGTPGVTPETVDGTAVEQMRQIIASLRDGSFTWQPPKRISIPKANGKQRPPGLPTWTDKLVQEVIRSILEPYYEAKFRDSSHGFRPCRGCHTALQAITKRFSGAKWFIAGDIKGCFDNIDHTTLLNTLRESIDDERFITLIGSMREAGYLEEWAHTQTTRAIPQGSVLGPLLVNVYMHKLDEFVEDTLIPQFTQGKARKRNPASTQIVHARARAKAQNAVAELKRLKQEQAQVPVGQNDDPEFRRLQYVRYADDFLLAFTGPKEEARTIKSQVQAFLAENLKLEMSEEKTLITHAGEDKARFLGYDIQVIQDDPCLSTGANGHGKHRKRAINGKIRLEVPREKIEAVCRKFRDGDQIVHQKAQVPNDDFSIVAWYAMVFRGVANYYCMAHDRSNKLNRLLYVMQWSLLKTLANKHRSSCAKEAQRFKVTVETNKGPRRAFRVQRERPDGQILTATFGGYTLGHTEDPIAAQADIGWDPSKEIHDRLMAGRGERCGDTQDIQVHHRKKLGPLFQRENLPAWDKLMAMGRRKTLGVGRKCHLEIHGGRGRHHDTRSTGEPDAGKPASPVRREAR
jgi:group II intron reverse transcriptase/maturase